MNQITIEHMTVKDIPTVAEIIIEAFNKPPVNESWTTATSRQHVKEELDTKFSFIAKEGETIVGALVGNTYTADKGLLYYIDILAVRENKRGHGIGEQLINKAVETAKKHNLTIIQLETSPRLRAFAWYKRHGFQESGWIEMEKTLV